MAKELNIRRVATLPSSVEPSTIYILRSQLPGKVDLMFVGDDVSEIRSILSIDDVNNRIMEVLSTWIPARSYKADALSNAFNLTLTGSVQGSVSIDGSRNVTMVTTGGGGGGGFPAPQMLLSESFENDRFDIEGMPIEECVIPNASWGRGSYGVIKGGVFYTETFEATAKLRFSVDPQDQIVERPFALRMTLWFDGDLLSDAPVNERVTLQLGYGMTYGMYLNTDSTQGSPAYYNSTRLQLYNGQEWLEPLYGEKQFTIYFHRGFQILRIEDVSSEVPSVFEYMTHQLSTAPMDWSNFQLDICRGIELSNLEIFTF